MSNLPTNIPFIEQVKIQAQVLVPLLKTLQTELGEQRANQLVRKALGDSMRKAAEQIAAQGSGTARCDETMLDQCSEPMGAYLRRWRDPAMSRG